MPVVLYHRKAQCFRNRWYKTTGIRLRQASCRTRGQKYVFRIQKIVSGTQKYMSGANDLNNDAARRPQLPAVEDYFVQTKPTP